MDRANCVTEILEPRRLLASISGTIIEDLDNDSARDGRERGLPGAIVFLDQNRNRQLDSGETSTTTDVNGFYEFTGLAPGQYFVGQIPPASYDQVYPPRTGFGDFGGNFDIVIKYTDRSISTKARSLFESAAARWEKVIVGDVSDVADDEIGQVDDIVITATARRVDGPGGTLAFAQVGKSRSDLDRNPFLPYSASMTFDTADANFPGTFDTIIHEMGHALGFTFGTWLSFVDEFDQATLVTGTFGDPRFIGANATREYNAIFKTNERGVPLEDFLAGSGSAFSHWRESVFGNELMSPTANSEGFGEPMSRVTVAAMQDIGYRVNYRGADPYDPRIQNLPTTQPDTAGGGLLDYSYTVQITADDQAMQGKDFFSRLNRRPTLDGLRADNSFAPVGGIVKLRAVGAADADAGDSVSAVNFYVETNGTPGLQVGAGGDTFVGTDGDSAGGFRVNANTAALGLAAGDAIFYARAYDQLNVAGKPRMITVPLFDPDAPPRNPTAITAAAAGPNEIVVSWNDRSNNEFGFRLERARDVGFTRGVRAFNVGADQESFNDGQLDPSTAYYYRVRAFNVGGASKFSGPFVTMTLARGEKVIDDSDLNEVSVDFPTRLLTADERALFGTTLGLFGDQAMRVNPRLQFKGRYTVYARWIDLGVENAVANFNVTNSDGRVQRPVTIDQNNFRDGGWVQIGQYLFNKDGDGEIAIQAAAGSRINIDALRFVPAFIPPA